MFTNKLMIDKECLQFNFIIQLMGAEPERSGEQCKILSLGLVIVNAGGKISIGFIKRCQVIAKT